MSCVVSAVLICMADDVAVGRDPKCCDVGSRSTITVFALATVWTQETLQNANIYNPLHIWEHISTWQPWLQRWRQQPHLESPGNFSCLANSHMCQTSPPTRHISHIPQECLPFYQVKRMNPMLHCVAHRLCAAFGGHSIRLFHLVQFVLCPVIRFFAVWLKLCFSQWVFMSSWANHKESLPVLSFPQWQWESWPRAWALAVALTLTYVLLLPVISDYIRFGNKDILGCQESSCPPPPDFHENGISKFHSHIERGVFARYHRLL